jgi:predicted permease
MGIAGRAPVEGQVKHREISPDYHRVMRVALQRGRLLSLADGTGSPYVVLINQTLADRFFPGEDPVGQRIAFDKIPDSTSTWRTIVGVVRDERQNSLSAGADPEIFAPLPQEPRGNMFLVLRTSSAPEAQGGSLRRIVSELDPGLAIRSMRTMNEVRAESLARDRFLAVLLVLLAGVGVILGVVGIYGVVSQLARRRTREMGIRIALGSDTRQVQWLVLRRGLGLAGLGLIVGVGLALGLTGIIRTLLFEVTPADPLTFLVVPSLMLLTAGAASWLPAWRASRADPCEVLRAE